MSDYPLTREDYREPPPLVAPTGTTAVSKPSTYTSSYQPTSTLTPYGRFTAPEKRQSISAELDGSWTLEADLDSKHSTAFWDTFFHDDDTGRICLQKLVDDGFYPMVDFPPRSGDDSTEELGTTMNESRGSAKRWKEMPNSLPPDSAHDEDALNPDESSGDSESTPHGILEKKITASFVPILNHIISTLGVGQTRVAVDGQEFLIPTRDRMHLKPDVFLWGKGSAAFRHIEGKPKPKPDPKPKNRRPNAAQRLLQAQVHTDSPKKRRTARKLAPNRSSAQSIYTTPTIAPIPTGTHRDDDQGAVPGQPPPNIDWAWCCVPIEVKTSSVRGSSNKPPLFSQLGSYVREVFAAQTHRRFVPSLIITECTVEFLLWDRAGVVVSRAIDYHADPLRFCTMLASLVTWDDQQLGFDPTIFYRDGQLHVITQEVIGNPGVEVEYIVEDVLFRSYTLRGRGSTCWRAHRKGFDDSHFIIQDSWVEDGMSMESDILHRIEEARREGDIPGVPRLVHIEEVRVWETPSFSDTTENNRRDTRLVGDVKLVHTRTVSQCTRKCTPLDAFQGPQELVDTLHDVIKALRDLYHKAQILHRDIAPWNILMQRGAFEGARGLLIDFSSAIVVTSPNIPPRVGTTPGSYLFRARNAMRGGLVWSHLDDLESLYYLFCFLIATHAGPILEATRLKKTSSSIVGWLSPDTLAAADSKHSHLLQHFELRVMGWYDPVKPLAKNLHDFFQRRISFANNIQVSSENSGKTIKSETSEDFKIRSYKEFDEFEARFHDTFAEPDPMGGMDTDDSTLDEISLDILKTLPEGPILPANYSSIDRDILTLFEMGIPRKRHLDRPEEGEKKIHKKVRIHDAAGNIVGEHQNVSISFED